MTKYQAQVVTTNTSWLHRASIYKPMSLEWVKLQTTILSSPKTLTVTQMSLASNSVWQNRPHYSNQEDSRPLKVASPKSKCLCAVQLTRSHVSRPTALLQSHPHAKWYSWTNRDSCRLITMALAGRVSHRVQLRLLRMEVQAWDWLIGRSSRLTLRRDSCLGCRRLSL